MGQTIPERLANRRGVTNACEGDSWRAGCIERVHVRFGGERLVLLASQDLASYPTRGTGDQMDSQL